jgi:hypothetical protein
VSDYDYSQPAYWQASDGNWYPPETHPTKPHTGPERPPPPSLACGHNWSQQVRGSCRACSQLEQEAAAKAAESDWFDRPGPVSYDVDPNLPYDLRVDLLVEAHGHGTGPLLAEARRKLRAEKRRESAWTFGRFAVVMVCTAVVAFVAKSAGASNGIVLVAGLVAVGALVIYWANRGKL